MKKLRDFRSMIRLLVGSSDDPAVMARGFSAGLFVAFSPLLGLHTAMAFGLAFLVRGNRLASFAASWLCNPVTMIPILLLDYRVGCLLLHCDAAFPDRIESLQHVLQLGGKVAIPLLAGGHLLALLVALAGYPLACMTFVWLRRGNGGGSEGGSAGGSKGVIGGINGGGSGGEG
ncbi:MAG: DUF2062 domain-containing protein [Deltaproteobacteria bacterium]|nr:DUF2062 domain-containing protein [Candidatus Anaeroferrophillacea bacterium]